jgi:cysteine desulfurase
MIYLDNAATTKTDPAVNEAIAECMDSRYGNPSSLHGMGQRAAAKAEECRERAANEIHAKPNEIFFSPGGTYSDNAAILGYARMHRTEGNHIITTQIEHPAVLNACKQLEREGFRVTYLPVSPEGIVAADDVETAIGADTILISVMHTNNEIGTVQPIEAIGALAKQYGIAFHCDAVQAFGKTDLNVENLHIDLMSVSAHKLYGPKGIGFLYVRGGIKLQQIFYGGEQEHGLFPGTLNAPLLAGFSKAIELISGEEKTTQANKIRSMRDEFAERILRETEGASLNGSLKHRSAEHANLFFEGVTTDALLYALDIHGICVSAGSACTAGSVDVSHVIRAIGKENGGASVRFSLGKYTTAEELEQTVRTLKEVLETLRK